MPPNSQLQLELVYQRQNSKVPVTIVTGYLGSGKTTLLNYILSKNRNKNICVINFEFGEVNVDAAMVMNSLGYMEDMTFETKNGCTSCTVRGDLVEAFKKIMRKPIKFDMIIIETTGLVNPIPVCQTFFLNSEVSGYAELDAVITVVDAENILEEMEEMKPLGLQNEAILQLSYANVILLNKCDLVDEEKLECIEQRIKTLNGASPLLRAKLKTEEIDLKLILGIDAFNLDQVMLMNPAFLDNDQEFKDDETISSVSFNFEGEVNIFTLQLWISSLVEVMGGDLWRFKGVLAVKGMREKYVLQGVHKQTDGNFGTTWHQGETRMARFSFIGKNLRKEIIENMFMDCVVTRELRFDVGDKVLCIVEEGWTEGVIHRVWDHGYPYRVTLSSGYDCWAPEDNDVFIKQVV